MYKPNFLPLSLTRAPQVARHQGAALQREQPCVVACDEQVIVVHLLAGVHGLNQPLLRLGHALRVPARCLKAGMTYVKA